MKKSLELGQISKLKGFGSKIEDQIRRALQKFSGKAKRFRLIDASLTVNALIVYLKQAPGIRQVTVAGSYRRRKDTGGDIDLLATVVSRAQILKFSNNYEEVDTVLSQGKTRSTVRLRSGIQVDLRVVNKEC